MTKPVSGKPRDNRVPIMLSDDELRIIDDWRFSNRIPTRSEAVRQLCQIGLAKIPFDGAASKA